MWVCGREKIGRREREREKEKWERNEQTEKRRDN
jgi:hypothetical protein